MHTPSTPERYDAEVVSRFLDVHGSKLGLRRLEIALMFWRDHLSYSEIAARLDIPVARPYEEVKRLRRIIRSLDESAAG